MQQSPLAKVLNQLRKTWAVQAARDLTDGELLRRFIDEREDVAFTVLVQRHGPMVLSICKRLLGDYHAAEDAFQATFVVLARRAASLRTNAPLGGWLYGVARRLASKAKAQTAARIQRERQVPAMPHQEPLDDLTWQELKAVLDEEVDRLPTQYRIAIILCHMQGKSHEQAAAELGWPKKTVTNRVVRGRELLREQLVRRGITLSVGAMATALAEKAAAAPVGAMLTINTVKAATLVAAGNSLASAVVSARVIALAEQAVTGMITIKTKLLVIVLALGLAAGGVGLAGISIKKYTSQRDQATKTPPLLQQPDKAVPAKKDVPTTTTDLFGDPLPPGALARFGTMRLRRDSQACCDLVFTPDGKVLIGARAAKVVQFWDAKTGQPLHELRHTERVGRLALSKDGSTLVTANSIVMTVWEVLNRKQLCRIATTDLETVAIAPDNKTIASAGQDKIIHIWDAATGQEKRQLTGSANSVRAVYFAPDGKSLISADSSSISVWDLLTGQETRKIESGNTFSVALSPDGTVLAAGRTGFVQKVRQNQLMLWDVASGKLLAQLDRQKHLIEGLAFSPDGKVLASDEIDEIYFWDVAAAREIAKIEKAGWRKKGMAFSPDGKTLASAAPSNESVIRLWDVKTGKPLQPTGHEGTVRAVVISPDGKLVATGAWLGNDFTIRLWDIANGESRGICEGHTSYIHKIIFTPDSKQLFSCGLDRIIRLWDAGTGKEIRSFAVDGSGNIEMTLSLDGKSLTSISHESRGDKDPAIEKVIVWDVATGKRLMEREGERTFGNILPISADGTMVMNIIRATKAPVFVQELTTGKNLTKLDFSDRLMHEYPLEAAAFSRDGRFAAVATDSAVMVDGKEKLREYSIRLWELVTGKAIRRIGGIKATPEAISFSPDGRTLVTAGAGPIQLWDLATGTEILRRDAQAAPVFLGAIAFTPDGTRIVTGYQDSTALLWDLRPAVFRSGLSVKDLGPKALDQLWSDLAIEDAAKAYQAIWTFVAAPKQSVLFLGDKLKPVALADSDKIRQWIADLDNERFAVRQAATKALEDVGDQVKPHIQQALEANLNLEARRRLEGVMSSLAKTPDPKVLREVRAIMVLETIGSSQARVILETLAAGARGARETEEARSALSRLATRPPPSP